MNLAPYVETASMLADAAGEIARESWHLEAAAAFKSDGSPVTQTDRDVEEKLRHILAARHPDHGVLGEEYGFDRRPSAFTWVIDPIDGTRQFAARLMNFGVLVALCLDGVPVIGLIDQPLAGVRCIAAKGEGARINGRSVRCRSGRNLDQAVISLANPRSFDDANRPVFNALSDRGSMIVFDGGCIAYMALAAGQTDVCLNGFDLDPYDICALVPVVEEAGGQIGSWDGRPLTLDYSGGIFAAGSAALHQEVRTLIDTTLSRPG